MIRKFARLGLVKQFGKIAVAVALFAFVLFITKPSAFADVVINEFVPNPGTGLDEWVEFYNTGSSTIDLSDYFFDDDASFDSDSGSSAKIALSGLLPSLQSCFWEMNSYLNNNGDSPSLFKLDGITADTYTYASSSAGFSYARIPDGGSWQAKQSYSKAINKCIDLAPSPTPTPTPTSAPTQTTTSTSTPTPTLTKTSTPTVVAKAVTISAVLNDILGESTQSAVVTEGTTSPIVEKSKTTKEKETKVLGENNSAKLLISLGIIFMLVCGILAFRAYRRGKNEIKNL